MQIVYISNRPKVLADTLEYVKALMPFISSAIVCAPENAINVDNEKELPLPVDFIAEDSLLTLNELASLTRLDHQSRNYLLRSKLISHEKVENLFLMSDDDARPLVKIDLTTFIENERHQAYYFHKLATWNYARTEFDHGQLATFAALGTLDYPTLSYASHMPQVIDKSIYLESISEFGSASKQRPLCEWTSYFNYGMRRHPDKYCCPKKYETLCWPESPLAWKQEVTPPRYLFENYTPALYQLGQVFDGLPTQFKSIESTESLTMEKIIRWRNHEIALRHPEQLAGISKYFNWRTWSNKLFSATNQ